MSLLPLLRPMLRSALVTALIVTVAACSDQSITANEAPSAPPAPNAQTSFATLRGTVRADGTVLLESLDPSIQVGDDNSSPAIYGNQNVTARVTTSAFSLVNNGTTKTWTFKLAVHNLQPFPVGSIDGAAVPYDTVGMYVFFPNAPTVVSPTNCNCAVSILKTQGIGNFTAPNQLYYWYHDRLAAAGQLGDSTTNNPTWTFTAPSQVNSFRFFVILSSPFARGLQVQDTTWSVFYNPATDSLPDSTAEPRWKRVIATHPGSYSMSAAGLTAGLTMIVSNHDQSAHTDRDDQMFFFRSDNLDRSEQAYAEAKLSLVATTTAKPVMILALADSVKFVGLGIGTNKIGFAKFDTTTKSWEWNDTTKTVFLGTALQHTYRVGKFGADFATVYVDGVAKITRPSSVLPINFAPVFASLNGAQGAKLSTLFGVTAQDVDARAVVSYVTYAFHATPTP
jgi:hypothetical protein